MHIDDSLEELTEDQCLALLNSRELGRIAFEFKGSIEIFPVNYGLEGRIIVFRTGPGTKLIAAPRAVVGFEVDSWDPESGIGWSVVAKGFADDVTTSAGRVPEYLRWVPVQPVAPGERWHWLAIKPTTITGRRFHAPPARHARPESNIGV